MSLTSLGEILVLVRHKTGLALYNGDIRAKASIHLCELQPDIAATNDDEVPRKFVKIEDRGAGQKTNVFDAGHVRDGRPGADVQEDVFSRGGHRR